MGRPANDVNTINVKEGMVFDSYNKLCYALDIEPISNHTQQLKRIGRCIEVEKVGYSRYLIKKIIRPNEISPNQSQRKLRDTLVNGKYLLPGACIILDQINKNKGKYICGNKELMYTLGMCNDVYAENDFLIDEYLEGLLSFSYNCNLTFNNILQQCILSGLCDRKRIFKRDYVILYSYDKRSFMLGDNTDYQNFNNIVSEIMSEYNITLYAQMFYTKNGKEAFHKLTKEIENRLGWKKFLRENQLSLCNDIPEHIIAEIKSNDVSSCRRQMNELTIDRIKAVMLKKGQNYYNYDPASVLTTVIGETNNVPEQGYKEYCSNLEMLINKYIKI